MQKKGIQKLLSFIYPIKLGSYVTQYNGVLNINLFDGKKTLDTQQSNYSYGSLQKILHQALENLPFKKNTQQILVLGMGGGSIVATIRNDFLSNAHITLVDIDPVIMEIAEKEFAITSFSNITMVCADALDFIEKENNNFDLIIVDLFINDLIPERFTSKVFIKQISKILVTNGELVFNTIRDTLPEKNKHQLLMALEDVGISVNLLENVDGSNDVILGIKKGDSYLL